MPFTMALKCLMVVLVTFFAKISQNEVYGFPINDNGDLEMVLNVSVVNNLGGQLLSCNASARYPPVIYWALDGIVVPSTFSNDAFGERAPMSREETNSKWYVPCSETPGVSIYTCIAETQAGQKLTKTIQIENAQQMSCPQIQKYVARHSPFIYMWTEMRMTRTNSTAWLPCRATGNPTPTINWYLMGSEGENLPLNTIPISYRQLPNGDLLVSELQSIPHMVVLVCEAVNEWGRDSVTQMIYTLSSDE